MVHITKVSRLLFIQTVCVFQIYQMLCLVRSEWSDQSNDVAGPKTDNNLQDRLMHDLFHKYEKDLRPVYNDSSAVLITMHLWFKQVLKVDEIDQILTIYCWTEQYWNDEFLAWNPADYDGITMLHIPVNKLWRPDILVYNNADMNINENEVSTNVVLNHTGDLICFRAIITKVTCNLDMTFFPFDQQKCNMTFASWSYDGSKVMITPKASKNNLEYYIENTEWKLLDFHYMRNVKYYDCCPEPYPEIIYNFVIERNPSYYILNLIIPSVFITVVTMVGFFTPYSSTGENTEKVSLGVTALLSLAIILLMVADKMPATSKVIPLIGKYYIGLIWLIFAATIITTVTLRLQSKGNAGKPLSPETKKLFFQYIAKFLFMKVDLPPRSYPAVSAANGGIAETSFLFESYPGSLQQSPMNQIAARKRMSSQIFHAKSNDTSGLIRPIRRRGSKKYSGLPDTQPETPTSPPLLNRDKSSSPPLLRRQHCTTRVSTFDSSNGTGTDHVDSLLEPHLARISKIVEGIDLKLAEESRFDHVKKEWEQLARVCERMLMIGFVFITVVFAVLMLHSHGQESFVVNL